MVCGEVPSLGSWNPTAGAAMVKHDDLWVLEGWPEGTGAGIQFKYVILAPKKPPRQGLVLVFFSLSVPLRAFEIDVVASGRFRVFFPPLRPFRWEGRPNRNWREAEAPVVTNIFDSATNERPKKPAHLKKQLSALGKAEEFIGRIVEENQDPSLPFGLEGKPKDTGILEDLGKGRLTWGWRAKRKGPDRCCFVFKQPGASELPPEVGAAPHPSGGGPAGLPGGTGLPPGLPHLCGQRPDPVQGGLGDAGL